MIGSLIGGGALVGLGKWIIDVYKIRAERIDTRTEKQESRERTIISEYQKILDEKDLDHGREREEWKIERKQLTDENAVFRRDAHRYIIDGEQMRSRIESLNRELARAGGSPRLLTDMLDTVLMADINGDIYWANEVAALFLRAPIEDIVTRNVIEFIPKSFQDAHKKGLERVRRRGPLARGEILEKVIRGRVRLSDSVEVPTDIFLSQFSMYGQLIFRAQMRRRFERPDDREPREVAEYIPATASASGIVAPTATPLVDPEKGRPDAAKA